MVSFRSTVGIFAIQPGGGTGGAVLVRSARHPTNNWKQTVDSRDHSRFLPSQNREDLIAFKTGVYELDGVADPLWRSPRD
jgi:hypothetical protein